MKLDRFVGQTARYTAIGGLCAGLNNLAVIGGSFLHNGYVTTSVAAFLVVTPLAYWLHTRFSFREARSAAGLLKYSAGVATALPMFLLCMFVLSTVLGVPVAVASPVATVLLFLWNYGVAHWSVCGFSRRPAPP